MKYFQNTVNRKLPHKEAAFSLLETMVTVSIILIVTGFTVSYLHSMRQQLRVSSARSDMSQSLNTVRAQAMRLRVPIAVKLTTDGLQWDVFDDGTFDGQRSLPTGVEWKSAASVDSFIIDGLGLIRGTSDNIDITLRSVSGNQLFMTINRNGHVYDS